MDAQQRLQIDLRERFADGISFGDNNRGNKRAVDVGAYGSAMASNYNRHPLPAEAMVDDGTWRVVRRRQTVDDMLMLESG